ncbi:unnamed protein product [Caenorhabditis nigoni]
MIDIDISALADNISRFCYIVTVFFNTLLIYLTTCHTTKQIVGTYRNMIVIFALLGMWFATTDILVRPLLHSYNGSFVYFTLGSTFRNSKSSAEKALLMYGGMYGVVISFIAVQFMYRACVLAKPSWAKHFDGFKLTIWLVFVLVAGVIWANGSRICSPDEYAYQYIEHEIMVEYGVSVRKIAIFTFLAYNADGTFRSNTLCSLGSLGLLAMYLYTTCLICGTIMYRRMQGSMSSFSNQHEKLQKQFFVALLYQITTPFLFCHIPCTALFLLPYLNLEIKFHSTIFLYAFNLYPLVDSMILLNVVSVYKQALKKFCKLVMKEWEDTIGANYIPEPSMSVVMSRM